jgi:hypothetical protein
MVILAAEHFDAASDVARSRTMRRLLLMTRDERKQPVAGRCDAGVTHRGNRAA